MLDTHPCFLFPLCFIYPDACNSDVEAQEQEYTDGAYYDIEFPVEQE